MRTLLYAMTALSVIGMAFWAYNENYATQEALDDIAEVRQDISISRARLAMLKAEWAYLNRPDRLMDLADLNYERLQLMPIQGNQFGQLEHLGFPPVNTQEIEQVIEVSSQEATQ